MEFTRLAFERVVFLFIIQGEIKGAKVEELIKNIPNSINNNKDNLEVVTIKKLKLRYNPKTLLTGKIISKISNYK